MIAVGESVKELTDEFDELDDVDEPDESDESELDVPRVYRLKTSASISSIAVLRVSSNANLTILLTPTFLGFSVTLTRRIFSGGDEAFRVEAGESSFLPPLAAEG